MKEIKIAIKDFYSNEIIKEDLFHSNSNNYYELFNELGLNVMSYLIFDKITQTIVTEYNELRDIDEIELIRVV